MNRLTYLSPYGVGLRGYEGCTCNGICDERNECDDCPIQEAFYKLAYYEDADEQGLLFHLPCKLGEDIYYIGYYCRLQNENGWDCPFIGTRSCDECSNFIPFIESGPLQLSCIDRKTGRLNEAFFASRKEAEAKLEEIKSASKK